jgi:hypothetical protein
MLPQSCPPKLLYQLFVPVYAQLTTLRYSMSILEHKNMDFKAIVKEAVCPAAAGIVWVPRRRIVHELHLF